MATIESPAWLADLALALTAEADLGPEDPVFVRAVVQHAPCAHARLWARRSGELVIVAEHPRGVEVPDGPVDGLVDAINGWQPSPTERSMADTDRRWVLLSLDEVGILEVEASALSPGDIAALVRVAASFAQRVQASNLLESIVENLPDMVFVKDARELRFVHFNRAGEEMLGFTREEMLGRNDYDLFPASEADFFTANDRAVLTSGEPIDIPDEPIHTADHGKRTLHTKKIPINGSDGRPRYLLGISRDITDQKMMDERLIQSQKLEAVAHLTSGLAHNFNNAAMVISGYAELALRSLEDTEPKTTAFLTKLRGASSRVADLADRLLGFARTRVLHPTVADVGALIAETTHMLARVIPEVVTIHVGGIEPDCFAYVDRAQLEQVVVNLAVNARDAMPDGGQLSVSVSRSELADIAPDPISDELDPAVAWICVTLADTGHGMPHEVRRRAFEPFYTTKRADGSGLGLFSAYEIVRRHDGHITIDSAVGQGTRVRVFLPAVEPTGDVASSEPGLEVGGEETVLLVEDDDDVRAMLAVNLEAHGYGVLSAANGVEALRLLDDLDDEPIDLLLSDVVMPQMGGPELALELRRRRPGLKVVLISGYTRDAEQLADDPSIVFCAKPVATDDLMAAIRTLLDRD